MDDKEQLITDVAKKIKELNELDSLEQLLKDNKHEFILKDKHYRVRKPTGIEKDEANKERMKKYFDMLKDPAYMFRKQLLALYKKKNVDVEAMEKTIKDLYLQEKSFYKKLAVTEDKADIEVIEQEIEDRRRQQQELFYEKEELLKYCIEKQLDDFLKIYLVYLCLEVKQNDKFERVYKSYSEFIEADDELLQAKAAQLLAVMIYNENI